MSEEVSEVIRKVVKYQVTKYRYMIDLDRDLANQLKGISLREMGALSSNIKAIIAYFYENPEPGDMISSRKAFWINANKKHGESLDTFYHVELGREVDSEAVKIEHKRHMSKIVTKFWRLGEKIFGVSIYKCMDCKY